MKKLMMFVLAMAFGLTGSIAQPSNVVKERKEIAKLTQKQLNEKATKQARKAAKQYSKEGWLVAPGHLPLEKQLDKAFNMQYEYDDQGYPKYMYGEATSVGENYDAAKMQALELAKLNLAGVIQTNVTALIESSVGNTQLAANEAASITETIMASKNLISRNIGRIIPVVECFRMNNKGNQEVRVMIFYNSRMALESAKQAVREDLTRKGEKLHEQLDKVLGF